jgi:hypothetical protein
MNDFLAFRKMITPLIIQVIFYIGAGLAALVGLITLIMGLAGGGIVMFFGGLVGLVLGPLVVRIYCELIILGFQIYAELVAIRTGTPPGGQGFGVLPPATTPPSATATLTPAAGATS